MVAAFKLVLGALLLGAAVGVKLFNSYVDSANFKAYTELDLSKPYRMQAQVSCGNRAGKLSAGGEYHVYWYRHPMIMQRSVLNRGNMPSKFVGQGTGILDILINAPPEAMIPEGDEFDVTNVRVAIAFKDFCGVTDYKFFGSIATPNDTVPSKSGTPQSTLPMYIVAAPGRDAQTMYNVENDTNVSGYLFGKKVDENWFNATARCKVGKIQEGSKVKVYISDGLGNRVGGTFTFKDVGSTNEAPFAVQYDIVPGQAVNPWPYKLVSAVFESICGGADYKLRFYGLGEEVYEVANMRFMSL